MTPMKVYTEGRNENSDKQTVCNSTNVSSFHMKSKLHMAVMLAARSDQLTRLLFQRKWSVFLAGTSAGALASVRKILSTLFRDRKIKRTLINKQHQLHSESYILQPN